MWKNLEGLKVNPGGNLIRSLKIDFVEMSKSKNVFQEKKS
jgi:hypothetical protein